MKYNKARLVDGIKMCRIEGCNNRAQKNHTVCSKHKHRRRKELALQKLFNKKL